MHVTFRLPVSHGGDTHLECNTVSQQVNEMHLDFLLYSNNPYDTCDIAKEYECHNATALKVRT